MNPILFLLSTRCTYAYLLYFTWIKIPDGYKIAEFEEVRLVINQSVVPVDLESSPEDRSCLSAIYTLRLYSLY